jgi:hypothetical protein
LIDAFVVFDTFLLSMISQLSKLVFLLTSVRAAIYPLSGTIEPSAASSLLRTQTYDFRLLQGNEILLAETQVVIDLTTDV